MRGVTTDLMGALVGLAAAGLVECACCKKGSTSHASDHPRHPPPCADPTLTRRSKRPFRRLHHRRIPHVARPPARSPPPLAHRPLAPPAHGPSRAVRRLLSYVVPPDRLPIHQAARPPPDHRNRHASCAARRPAPANPPSCKRIACAPTRPIALRTRCPSRAQPTCLWRVVEDVRRARARALARAPSPRRSRLTDDGGSPE